jgi:hypothetical protein
MLGYLDYRFDETEQFGALFTSQAERHNLLISRNHGHYAFGRTAGEAFFRSFYLRQACEIKIQAMSTSRELHLISDTKAERFQEQMYASPHYNYDGATEWPGLIRKLDRECPGYDRLPAPAPTTTSAGSPPGRMPRRPCDASGRRPGSNSAPRSQDTWVASW